MRESNFHPTAKTRTLFVWDGTKDHLWHAELCISAQCVDEILVVHPMPHESIYGDVTCCGKADEKVSCERELRRIFGKLTRGSVNLCGQRLRFLYGDRIREVIEFAKSNHVANVLMPRFCQSAFSKWIHGDLNELVVAEAHCPVVFLESGTTKNRTRSSIDSLSEKNNRLPIKGNSKQIKP